MQMLALAQSNPSEIPPPSPPFVQFPQPDMAFTITVTAPDGQPIKLIKPLASSDPSAPKDLRREMQLVRIDAVQVGNLRCDISTYNENTQTQTWFVGHYGLLQSPQGGWINVVDPVRYPVQAQFMPRRDASDYFLWLSSSNYVKVVSYQGKPCYQFKVAAPGAKPTDENNILDVGEKIAWVDVKTKLPIAIQFQGQLFTYTFRDSPSAPLVPPQQFQALIDRFWLLGSPPPPVSH
jgi:hypothetical protein